MTIKINRYFNPPTLGNIVWEPEGLVSLYKVYDDSTLLALKDTLLNSVNCHSSSQTMIFFFFSLVLLFTLLFPRDLSSLLMAYLT